MNHYLNILIIIYYIFNIIACHDPIGPNSFFTYEDLEIANSLTDNEIDKGLGKNRVNSQLNPNFYGGDIVDKPKRKKDVHGYITKSSGRHWPNGRVPFQFVDPYSHLEKAHVKKAIEYLEKSTCIRFVPREPTDRNYIRFIKDKGCYSQDLGRLTIGAQNLSLGPECFKVDVIIHELMHAIGFMHEFSRPDRDNYIQVNYHNMKSEYAPQFQTLRGEFFGDWKLPFDIKSVMFYEGNAAAKIRGLTVMKAKDGRKLRCRPSQCPTQLDIEKINTIYSCNSKTTDTRTTDFTKRPRLPQTSTESIPDITESYEKNMCSLEWKSANKIINTIDIPVPTYDDKSTDTTFICKFVMGIPKLNRNITYIGTTDKYLGCVPLRSSWSHYNAEILVNNYKMPLKWKPKVRGEPQNGIYAGKSLNGMVYVSRCADPKDIQCSQREYLTCEKNSFN